jgi:AraC-like DNA-binding protein/NADH:ubiquinone oxidoreductase subunit 6 (subunit J)
MLHYLAVFTPAYTTLFWAIVFLSEYNKRHRAKHALGFFMLVAAALYTCHAFFFMGMFDVYLNLDALYVGASLALYPMFYVYTKHLTSEMKYRWFNIVHFIPAIVLSSIMLFVHMTSNSEQRVNYLSATLVNNEFSSIFSEGAAGWLARIHYSVRLLYLVQIAYYGYKAFFLVDWYNKRLSNFYSNLESRKLWWLRWMTIVLITLSVCGVIANFVGRGSFSHNQLALFFASMLFSTLLFLLGLMGNKQNSSLWDLCCDEMAEREMLDASAVYKGSFYREKIRETLSRLMKIEEVFLQSDLTVSVLSRKLQTSHRILLTLIKEEYGEDFYGFVNRYRVSYVKKEVRTNRWTIDQSVDALAGKAGFLSVGNFHKAFKAIEGIDFDQFLNANVFRCHCDEEPSLKK